MNQLSNEEKLDRLRNQLRVSAAWHLRNYLNFQRGIPGIVETDRQAAYEYAEYLRLKEDAAPQSESEMERYCQDREENPASHAFIASMN